MVARTEIDATVADALRAVDGGAVPRDLESGLIDFKEFKPGGRNDRDPLKAGCLDVAEAMACLVNTAGGAVVVGVADRTPGPAAYVGIPGGLTVDHLRRQVWELTTPHLHTSVTEVGRNGRRLLVVAAEPTFDLYKVGGRWRERIGSSCETMSPERVARVQEDRHHVDWSAEPTALTVSDVQERAIEEARERLIEAGDAESARRARLSREDLLRELGVVDDRARLLRAGALLFTTSSPGPDARIQYLRKDTPGGPLTMSPQLLDIPLLISIQQVLLPIGARTPSIAVNLPTGVQVHLETLPGDAVRESVINAVAHRDYRLPEPIVVEHSADQLVVTSPGGFVEGIRPENIISHPSKPRNRVLAEALSKLHLAERAGTGVDLMVRAMIRSGHEPPAFIASPHSVRLALPGGPPTAQVARIVAALPKEVRDDTDAVLIVHYLLTHAKVTADGLAPIIQKPVDEARRALRTLAHDQYDLLESTRATAAHRNPTFRFREGPRAELGTLLPYHRQAQDSTDRQIVAHVREYGTVSNETVRNLCQVKAVRASQILRSLVDRDILVRTADSPARGRGVRYQKGARFPSRLR